MCKLKFYWFKIWMTTNDKNRKESKSSLKAKYKVESIFLCSNCLPFCVLTPIQIYLHRMYGAGAENGAKHFAVKFCQISQGTKSLLT